MIIFMQYLFTDCGGEKAELAGRVYRDDSQWRADDEAPPPYVEPLSCYSHERHSVDVDRLTSRHHQRLATTSSQYLTL